MKSNKDTMDIDNTSDVFLLSHNRISSPIFEIELKTIEIPNKIRETNIYWTFEFKPKNVGKKWSKAKKTNGQTKTIINGMIKSDRLKNFLKSLKYSISYFLLVRI